MDSFQIKGHRLFQFLIYGVADKLDKLYQDNQNGNCGIHNGIVEVIIAIPDSHITQTAGTYHTRSGGGVKSGYRSEADNRGDTGNGLDYDDVPEDLDIVGTKGLGCLYGLLADLLHMALNQTAHVGGHSDAQREDSGLDADGGTGNKAGYRNQRHHENDKGE